MLCKGYAASSGDAPLRPFTFERREPRMHDVLIDILFCGICHSDVHQARDEWGTSIFPMVPGHEIVGRVADTGAGVTRFTSGDLVGVGCFVESCRTCPACLAGDEHFCAEYPIMTYNAYQRDGTTPTYGGYSDKIVVDEDYVVRVPSELSPAAAAPLLCAGVTTYSPLRHWGAGEHSAVGVVGLGGLGHVAVKLAAAMGAKVTVLSSSERKRADAVRLGASDYAVTDGSDTRKRLASHFDLILNTVSATADLDRLMQLVAADGTMVLLGVADGPISMPATPFMKRRRLSGSMIGSMRETQETLDFCADRVRRVRCSGGRTHNRGSQHSGESPRSSTRAPNRGDRHAGSRAIESHGHVIYDTRMTSRMRIRHQE